MEQARHGLARMHVGLLVVLIAVAAGVGAYVLYAPGSGSGSGSQEVSIQIRETDPANQIDSFIPGNITAKLGTTVNLVVQNTDDELRVFTISDFNVNMTILSGTVGRSSFTADKTGTFIMHSPQTKPSAVSHGKPGSAVTGYVTVNP